MTKTFAFTAAIALLAPACQSNASHVNMAQYPARTVQTVGGELNLDLPAGYRRRNPTTDCYSRVVEWPAIWREFCVWAVASDSERSMWWETDSTRLPPRCVDCSFHEQIRFDTVSMRPHVVVRQRALVSGTIQHYRRHPVWMLHIALTPTRTAVFVGDDHFELAGEEELLAIARTIRLNAR